MMSMLCFVTDAQTYKMDSSPIQEFIDKLNKALEKNNIIMSILQSENCTQTCLGPGKYLFSYSTEYNVCRPTKS